MIVENIFPKGKDDKPVLFEFLGEATYNIDEVDGALCLLNRDFSGCVTVTFSKKLNDSIYGKVTIDGRELKKGIICWSDTFGGIQLLGIPVRGVLTEYDKVYLARIEGFVDVDGNMMDAQVIRIRTLSKGECETGYEAHERAALQAAREGIVLLKNEENLLPLKQDKMLNVFGKGLHQFRIGSYGAGKINPRYHVSMLEAIEKYSNFTLNPALTQYYSSDMDEIPSEEMLEEARRCSDTAVIMISRSSGENMDNRTIKGEYYLTDEELALIQAVVKKFDQTIAIVNSGYPIDIAWVEKFNIKALIWCGFVGMLGAPALIEIMDGRTNPSGKLPDTWAKDYFDIPASQNFYNAVDGKPILFGDTPVFVDTYYEEDIYVGYRYFETFNKEVAYPFGYGLSYTNFQIKTIGFEQFDAHTKITVTAENVGKVAGQEVVQVYSEEPDGKLEKPAKKLVAFAKSRLLYPGDKQTMSFVIKMSHYTSYDSDTASWIMEKGTYTIWVGNSVKHLVVAGCFELDETKTIKQVVNRMVPPIKIRTLSKWNPEGTYPTGAYSGLKSGVHHLEPKAKRIKNTEKNPVIGDAPGQLISYPDVVENPALLSSFVKQLSLEELARLSVCASSGWGMHGKGEAGRIFLLEKYDMKPYVVADGNNGVNVNKPNIGMPSSVTVCASFNSELAYEIGRVIAEEAKEHDIHMILAPGMNIHRNPLNGRHPEYFSEDPYLAGVMAGHMSKGLEENGVSSSLKHVVANNCESARKRNHSLLTERAMREIYLKAFEVAIQIHKPDSIMTAYNAANGVFMAEDEEMIQDIFRDEFGFEGFVMTDWTSYESVDVVESVQAGNCWITPGTLDDTYVKPIIEGVQEGRIDRNRLERNVFFMLRVILKRSK